MESDRFDDTNGSGVSWGAVVAGAFVTASLSLALLALGTGVGLSIASPWANSGASASAIGWTAIIWLVLMQIIAFSVGGYLAGRLRTRWVNIHTHEVYFRDTAHGFLVWAVGLVMTAAFLTSAAASMIGGVAHAGAAAAEGSSRDGGPNGYLVDTMLRATPSATDQVNPAVRGEVAMIFANDLRDGSMPPADRSYIA